MQLKVINKTLLVAVLLLSLGTISIAAENTLYQYIDENGTLHESLFLPLGALCLALGSLALLVGLIQKALHSRNRS